VNANTSVEKANGDYGPSRRVLRFLTKTFAGLPVNAKSSRLTVLRRVYAEDDRCYSTHEYIPVGSPTGISSDSAGHVARDGRRVVNVIVVLSDIGDPV